MKWCNHASYTNMKWTCVKNRLNVVITLKDISKSRGVCKELGILRRIYKLMQNGSVRRAVIGCIALDPADFEAMFAFSLGRSGLQSCEAGGRRCMPWSPA